MSRFKNTEKILKILREHYPQADCALRFSNPIELLVATILSAQCTDKRVNLVTPTLFQKYRTAQNFARASVPQLEKEIRSTGFYRQKAKWICGACKRIVQEHGGQVPRTMAELTALPGVARKTANVVLGTAFHIAAGIVVDTHVKRLARRLGLSKNEDPVKVEQDLIRLIPKKDWIWFAHALIAHGRQLCKAISPRCVKCPLNRICPAAEI